MRDFFKKATAALLFLLLCTPVFAQDYEQENTRIRVTPRLWLSYISPPVEDFTSTETFLLPLYGATVSVTPGSASNFNFMLTSLYGEGSGDTVVFWAAAPFNTGEMEVERLDVELLARYNFPGRNVSVFAGPRYVELDTTEKVPAFAYQTDTESTMWVAEAGFGTVANITENGRHRLFGNLTFGIAWTDWDWRDTDGLSESGSDTSPLIDFNAGYQYTVGEHLSLSIRYRLFTITGDTEVTDAHDQDKLTTIHGPDFAFTVTF